MATVQSFSPSNTVLVTGANGHVAQHVVAQLLELPGGPQVRASVRSDSSASALKSVFAEHVTSGRLNIVIVSDITDPDALMDAVRDVTHIAHIASPLVVGVEDPEKDLLIPAINGTTSVLKAALHVKSVKAIVVTGSMAGNLDVSHGFRPGYRYTASDWNPITYAEAADPNLDLTRWGAPWQPFITYMASKVLAEKAAWSFYEKEKPSWGLAMLNPGYIGGPYVLPPIKGAQSLSWSTGLIWKVAVGEKPENDYPFWVDVRDVARAHVRALLRPQAWGRRWIVAPESGSLLYGNVIDEISFGKRLRTDLCVSTDGIDHSREFPPATPIARTAERK